MLPWCGIDRAEVEQISVGIVAVDFEHFGNETPSWPALDLNEDIEQIADVGLDGAKANVRPDTTIATSESPRAMVLVNACCSTLTAFSHGELPVCANAGAARHNATR
jgi:hypothetical protein